MREEHLDILRCPITGEELKLIPEKYADDGHIEYGELVSSASKYPIINGIPRFILSQSPMERKTVQAFGDQWCEAGDFSLSYGMDAEYFRSYLHPLSPEAFKDSIILDAGCGNGRLIEFSMQFYPKLIIGLDYSHSVDLAFNRTRSYKNVLIVQGSILSPPLKHNSFNIVYSLGVIHHLEMPEKGLLELGRLLTENGNMHIWMYSREGNEVYLMIVRPLRWVAQRMPSWLLWLYSRILAIITWPYLYLCFKLSGRSSRPLLPMQEYMSFIFKFGFRIYELVIHDQLAPSIAFYPSRNDTDLWVEASNLEIFHRDMRTNNSWRIGLKRQLRRK